MAEYYVGIFDNTWKSSIENRTPFQQVDFGINDNLLHAAEVHLKLATAKRLVEIDMAGG